MGNFNLLHVFVGAYELSFGVDEYDVAVEGLHATLDLAFDVSFRDVILHFGLGAVEKLSVGEGNVVPLGKV